MEAQGIRNLIVLSSREAKRVLPDITNWKGGKKGGGGDKPKKEKTVPVCGICEKKGHKDEKCF